MYTCNAMSRSGRTHNSPIKFSSILNLNYQFVGRLVTLRRIATVEQPRMWYLGFSAIVAACSHGVQ